MALAEKTLQLLSEGGALAARLPGFVPRTSQLEMAGEVAQAIEERRHLVVEAGTGTGKSLAYLAAAALSDKQVIIATGTKALQDQLMEKDLPVVLETIAETTGRVKRAALMKGRQNYLCKVRFERFRTQPRFVFAEDKDAYPSVVAWAETTLTGDRAEIEDLPDAWATWSDLDAGSDTCIGQRCPHYQDCFVTEMRRRAADADIIVVNHHLLCADQRVRFEGMPRSTEVVADEGSAASFAQVLPDADAIIIDEAHSLPEVASDYFGVSLSSARLERLLRDLRLYAESLQGPGERLSLLGAAEAAERALAAVFEQIATLTEGRERVRLDVAKLGTSLDARAMTARDAIGALSQRLDSLAGDEEEEERVSYRHSEGKSLQRRAEQIWIELDFLLGKAREDPSFVAYCEPQRRGIELGAVPIDVAGALSRTLFASQRPVILTSATLSVARSTRRFEVSVGLFRSPSEESSHERPLIFPSPFDYARRAALYAPQGMPDPDAPDYFERFLDETRHLLTLSQGGALLLFTSYRALERTYEALEPWCVARGITPLCQGSAPKARLLDTMRAASKVPGAALFATLSFWEGVDVPGAALRLVVIDRLPFRAPNDPVQEARAELCRQRGRHPFREIALPEAALLLKQGAGRLLRTEQDAGVVAILDGRLRGRNYGKLLLDTLPPMTRVGSRVALSSFWTRFVSPTLGLDDTTQEQRAMSVPDDQR
ncbi:MAG: ATP-dependent DNA helicase [Myxococcota bacterium]